MERSGTSGPQAWMLATAFSCAGPVWAADIGGWYAEQQRLAAQAAAGPAPASCAEALARASARPSGLAAYRAALCYLTGERPDLVAARAWLTQASEMDFLAARGLLRSLSLAEAGAHPQQHHCHDLGEGRQLCHGGRSQAALPVEPRITIDIQPGDKR